jgi:hypothetical protein
MQGRIPMAVAGEPARRAGLPPMRPRSRAAHIVENELYAYDPIHCACQISNIWFTWAEVPEKIALTSRQRAIPATSICSPWSVGSVRAGLWWSCRHLFGAGFRAVSLAQDREP